jgi:pimeloyl-ACP methyl ester carboxylesterase
VLVGHSIAGEELSSIGSRYPDKVAGLVYLDAGYSYAYYDQTHGDLLLDSLELRKKLGQLIPGTEPQDQKQLVEELLQTRLPQLEKDLREQQRALQVMPTQQQRAGGFSITVYAVLSGQQKYTAIPVPILEYSS